MQVGSLGQEDPLEEGMAIHSSILAWRIPRTEDPGRLWSTGSQSQTRLKQLSSSSSRTSSTTDESGYFCLSLDLRGKVESFAPLSMM